MRNARHTGAGFLLLAMVNMVPVNYAIRFSGPVTSSPPDVSGIVSDSPHLPARCCARYKCSLVPRRFSLQLPHSFSPVLSSSAPLTSASFTSASITLKPCGPPPTVTTRPMRKMAQHDLLPAFASCPATPLDAAISCLFAHPSIPPSSPAA
jgi:hypothetical protein